MAAPVVPDVTFEYQEKHDLMIGKAFDCRLGCTSILRTLDNLRDKTLNVDVTGAFAVQEEDRDPRRHCHRQHRKARPGPSSLRDAPPTTPWPNPI